ncbi:MAG: hypothetical protein O3B05_01825 [archaeon]|nr:hypothetical protein [archaeon]
MKRPWRAMLLAALVVLLPATTALPPPEVYDATPHDGPDFPVGWTDLPVDGAPGLTLRLHYPAMEEGEDATMAGNGPFTTVLFLPDDGEDAASYDLLAAALVERGHAVAVSDGVPPDAQGLTVLLDRLVQVNAGDGSVAGAQGGLSSRWSLGGHGSGAMSALVLSADWDADERGHAAPDALFGLGLDDDGTLVEGDGPTAEAESMTWLGQRVALLITGSVDDIAPVGENVLPMLNGEVHLGFHVMTVLGANHHQWQDETGFFEFGDGDATITQEEQISIAAAHVVAFLDLTTKGDLDAFPQAFNRAADGMTVSDPDAYVDEDLLHSRLLRFNLHGPSAYSSHGMGGHVEFTADVGVWDGANISSEGRTVVVECEVLGASIRSDGSISEAGEASCGLDPSALEPGPFDVRLSVYVDGVPAYADVPLLRSNGALMPVLPLPVLSLEQGSQTSVDASSLATDPDGTDVRFTAATSVGPDASRFSPSIVDNGQRVVVSDASTDDWEGVGRLNVSLEAVGDARPLVLELEVVMEPVDNPVEVLAAPTTVVMSEDESVRTVNLSAYAADPEGAPLVSSVGGGTNLTVGPVHVVVDGALLHVTPLPDAFGSTMLEVTVGDGSTEPVVLEVPVVVEGVDDPLRWNVTSLVIDLVEDVPTTVDLSSLGWDPDGVAPSFTLLGVPDDQELLSLGLVGTELTLAPLAHANGHLGLTIRMSTGNESLDMITQVVVAAVEDAGSLRSVTATTSTGDQLDVRWTVVDPDDMSNASFVATVVDATGAPLVLAGTVTCGPPLLDSMGSSPAWAVTCDGVWGLAGVRLDGLVLRVVEERPDLDEAPTYVQALDVTGVAAPSSNDDGTSLNTTPLMLVGGVLVALVLVLLARRGGGSAPLTQEPPQAPKGLLERAAGKQP